MPDEPASDSSSSITAAIELLLRSHPRGLTISEKGRIILAEEATRLTSFDQLSEMTRAPKTMQFDLPGKQRVQLTIRALNAIEAAEADKINADILPPKKEVKAARQGAPAVMEYDFDDAGYQAKIRAGALLKRAFVIATGIVGMQLPGETLEAKSDYLTTNFPPRILDALQGGILALTSDPIETADFI